MQGLFSQIVLTVRSGKNEALKSRVALSKRRPKHTARCGKASRKYGLGAERAGLARENDENDLAFYSSYGSDESWILDNSKAVHRAYAKRALMNIPLLEDYEQRAM